MADSMSKNDGNPLQTMPEQNKTETHQNTEIVERIVVRQTTQSAKQAF
jgi:hypothetical protein